MIVGGPPRIESRVFGTAGWWVTGVEVVAPGRLRPSRVGVCWGDELGTVPWLGMPEGVHCTAVAVSLFHLPSQQNSAQVTLW